MRRIHLPHGALLITVLLAGGCGETAEQDMAVVEAPDTAVLAEPAPAAVSHPRWVDPNQASRDDLLSVPHVDAALADELIAGRPYPDMLAVDGVLAQRLDGTQRDSVYTRLWIPIDLNAASGDEIMLIPGVGERMRHEFEEYRPYRAIAEFRREIGKYVDDGEVARLERYVVVR